MNAPISPVAVFPSKADDLYLRAGSLGTPPTFYYELRALEIVSTTSTDADGKETTTESEQFRTLCNGNVNMTDEQWNKWSEAADDESYMLSCAAANLGLSLA